MSEDLEHKLCIHIEKLEAQNRALIEALEKISKEQNYTESQSTGARYYHDTEGSEIARKALEEWRDGQ